MRGESDSRGEEQGPVHQAAVVVIVDEVVHCCGVVACVRSVHDLDADRIVRVVEVDDKDVKNQYSGGRDNVSCGDFTV